jgi:hypothetical protein
MVRSHRTHEVEWRETQGDFSIVRTAEAAAGVWPAYGPLLAYVAVAILLHFSVKAGRAMENQQRWPGAKGRDGAQQLHLLVAVRAVTGAGLHQQ